MEDAENGRRGGGAGSPPDGEAGEGALAGYRALREGCALARGAERGLLDVRGEDRVRFVQGMVTCDVKPLAPGEGAYGFVTNARGGILADVVVAAAGDRLRLVLPAERVGEVESHLRRYIVADRVELDAAPGLERLLAAGPRAAELLEGSGASGAALPLEPWRHRETSLLDATVWLLAEGRSGVPAISIWVPSSHAEALRAALLRRGAALGVVEAAAEALETVRVEEGIPRYGREFGLRNLPQETGIEAAVSYEKGCYLGQEVVARIHYRGQVNRALRGLVFDGPPAPPGAVLSYEGRPAGAVGTAVRSPRLGRAVGLALLHRRAAEPGLELALEGGGRARVSSLPFSSGPARR